mgnify:FL=1
MLWRKIIGYWKSFLVISAIAYVCLLREPSMPLPAIEGADKWAHTLMYLVLTLVLLWDSKRTGCQPWLLWTIAIAIPVIYGGFIEIMQDRYCYPRTGDWMDWLADCVGVALAVGGWIIGTKWYERRVAQ